MPGVSKSSKPPHLIHCLPRGHMTKAMRMMEEHLSLVDGIVFVLDARCPAASFNAKLKKMANNKPVLYGIRHTSNHKTENFVITFFKRAGALFRNQFFDCPRWRKAEAKKLTAARRPDLLNGEDE